MDPWLYIQIKRGPRNFCFLPTPIERQAASLTTNRLHLASGSAPVSIRADGDEVRKRPFDPGKHSPPETEKGPCSRCLHIRPDLCTALARGGGRVEGFESDRARLRWTEPAQAAEDPWANLRTSWQEESFGIISFAISFLD